MALDFDRIADPVTVERGKNYFRHGCVVELDRSICEDCSGLILRSAVEGRKTYRCTIHISDPYEGSPFVEAGCSCPMGFRCKHIVATLEAWLASSASDAPALPAQPETSAGGTPAVGATAVPAPNVDEPTILTTAIGWEDDLVFRSWLKETKELAEQREAANQAIQEQKPGQDIVIYALTAESVRNSNVFGLRHLSLVPQRARIKKNGDRGKPQPASIDTMASVWKRPRYASDDDVRIAQLLQGMQQGAGDARTVRAALELATATGRLHFVDQDSKRSIAVQSFDPDQPAQAAFGWHIDDTGRQWLNISPPEPPNTQDQAAGAAVDPVPAMWAGGQLWWVDPQHGRLTRLEFPNFSETMLNQLLQIPAVSPIVAKEWHEGALPKAITSAVPLPKLVNVKLAAPKAPTPVLTLRGITRPAESWRWRSAVEHEPTQMAAQAELTLRYGDKEISRTKRQPLLRSYSDGTVTVIERAHAFEERLDGMLEKVGLDEVWSAGGRELYEPDETSRRATRGRSARGRKDTDTTTASDQPQAFWFKFVDQSIPRLRKAGWDVIVDRSFPFMISEAAEWVVELDESGVDWFGIELGIQVGDEQLPAAPLLAGWLRAHGTRALALLEEKRAAGESILLVAEDGRQVRIAAERVWRMMSHLLGYFDQEGGSTLRLGSLQTATLLADLENEDTVAPSQDANSQRWAAELRTTITALKSLARKASATPAPKAKAGARKNKPRVTPKGLKASLRDYQQEGLDWLQTLHRAGLGGILADDMGLGKTVQLLSHLLLLKEQRKLTLPALVVAPTSVVGEWQREAARFAPGLSVLAYCGAERGTLRSKVPKANLVLTSYALLYRDAEFHSKQAYSVVALDEAQYVKNDQTATTRAAAALQAEQRVCLTGTPLENHLGELWSLMSFVAPSSLGNKTWFRTVYRTPIEKHGNPERLTHLQRRVRPFILRRSKALVAKELPPKTEIVRESTLSQAQRDIYETVRATMEKRVRDEIAKLGLARSQIIVLDALLKLRQVCCHPGLLKWHQPTDGIESAKFEDFKNLLTSLLKEGRRVLVFSQFVKMLNKIEEWLDQEQVAYAKLTGSTKDRPKQIKRFTSQAAPVFLISLKAGGTGLNLTEADTVIHYDPWWNPAVEAQATDRAHRIGQNKKVFVYRMITKGTVEEAILALHKKKKGLSDAILSGSHERLTLSEKDIDALFAAPP